MLSINDKVTFDIFDVDVITKSPAKSHSKYLERRNMREPIMIAINESTRQPLKFYSKFTQRKNILP